MVKTFWNNLSFRGAGTLFGLRDEEDAEAYFVTIVNDQSSVLYPFIDIK